jgi:ABC-2 type transport system ATP-binding protein
VSTAGSVRVEDVRFGYRHGFVLGPLTFSVGRGITGLMGPNGAGKTTLSRLVCGAIDAHAGGITIDDVPVGTGRRGRAAKQLVGYVPQHLGFPARARVADVLQHAAWLRDVPGARRPAAVESALQAVGLPDQADARCRTLSGGMLRRLAVAQALVHSPPVLFLDEPTTGLDPRQRTGMRDHLRRIGANRTIILATHLAEDVQVLADRVLVLAQGQQVFHGSVPALLDLEPQERVGMSRIDAALESLLGGVGRSRP